MVIYSNDMETQYETDLAARRWANWLLGVDEMSNGDTQADLKEIANLYAAASEDDRAVVRAVLKKYKIHPESNG